MTAQQSDQANSELPLFYEIRVKGHLDGHWAAWFEDLAVSPTDNGETILNGPVTDQAALHGLLRKIRDLGLTLIAVSQVQPGQPDNRA